MKLILMILTVSSLFAQSALTNDTLRSLQQLRTVIPERLWEQEFSILVDTKAFEEQAKKMMERKRHIKSVCAEFAIAPSRDYFLFATMSGETIRIMDQYQEFEEGVFWRTPAMMDTLEWMEQE